MPGDVKRQNSKLQGVKCAAKRCYYWGDGDCCMASQIEIRSPQATSSQETDCETFYSK